MAVAFGQRHGRQYKCEELDARFPNMLVPFYKFKQYPTIFRLPLRTCQSQDLRKLPFSPDMAMQVMQHFISEAEDLLLFSKFVSRLVVWVVPEDKDDKKMLDLQKKEEGEGLSSLMQTLPRAWDEVERLKLLPQETVAKVKISGSIDCATVSSSWLVSHSLSVDVELLQLAWEFLHPIIDKNSVGTAMLPHGAVAVRMSGTQRHGVGSMCCYLPLRNLPVFQPSNGQVILVHGCFNISSCRKQIPMPQANKEQTPAERWNHALLNGPVAASFRKLLLQHGKDVNDLKSVKCWFELLGLLDDAKNQASAQIRSVLREALVLKMLQSNDAVFPVVTEKNFLNWQSAPVPLRGAPGLPGALEDLLILDGLQLATLPEPLHPIFGRAATKLNRQHNSILTPQELCIFLRSLKMFERPKALESQSNIDLLLRFVVTNECTCMKEENGGAFKGNAKGKLDLSILCEVPLLVCCSSPEGNGDSWRRKSRFGKKRVFWEGSHLLPMASEKFICSNSRDVLRKASVKLEDVLFACRTLNIHRLVPSDLLEHRHAIHEMFHKEKKSVVSNWLSSFWKLMWETHEASKKDRHLASFCGTMFDDFADWTILKVFSQDCTDYSLLKLDCIKSTFSLHETEALWQSEIAEILRECGVEILYNDPEINDQPQRDLLLAFGVHFGHDAFVSLLQQAHRRETFKLSIKGCAECLKYFSKRKDISTELLEKIKTLPLFVHAKTPMDPNAQNIIALNRHDRFFCLYNDENLKRKPADAIINHLDIPKACFLALPTTHFKELYLRLGVIICGVSDFMVKYVPAAMAKNAQFGYVSIQPFLRELEAWGDESSSTYNKVYGPFKDCKFVIPINASSAFCLSPSELTDPGSDLAQCFKSALKSVLPSETYWVHTKLLGRLGMKETPSPELLLKCAEELDRISDNIPCNQVLSEENKNASYVLVEALCRAFREVWQLSTLEPQPHTITHGSKEMQHLHKAASLRILQVVGHNPRASTENTNRFIQQCVEGRAADKEIDQMTPDRVWLSPMKGVAMPECARLTWGILPIIQKTKTDSQLARLTQHYASKLNEMQIYTSNEQLPMRVLASQLGIVSRAAEHLPSPSCFGASSLLAQDVLLMYDILQRLLQDEPSQKEELAVLKTLRCIYKHRKKDASGMRADGGQFEMLRPTHVFEKLPDEAHQQNMFQEVDRDHYTVFKALGVRESPGISDWVQCTLEVYEQVQSQAGGGAEEREKESTVLDKEVRVIKAASLCVSKLLKDTDRSKSSKCYDLFLIDENKKIVSGGNLLYNDRLKWQERCKEIFNEQKLRFVDQDSLKDADFDLLCKYTKLRKLSNCVRETLGGVSDGKRGQIVHSTSEELKFEDFVRSAEFSQCIWAFIIDNHDFKPARISQVLNSVTFNWVIDLFTTLEIDGQKLTASEQSAVAFFDAYTNTIWVRSAQLESGEIDVVQIFVRTLAEKIASILKNNKIPVSSYGELVMVQMLEHWNKGSDSLLREIAREYPDYGKDILSLEKNSRDSPGMPVPIEEHQFLVQNPNCLFDVEELVALLFEGREGISSYIFARVRDRQMAKGMYS